MTTLAQESISGLFRGICVDNKDPERMGRIRVQVPQILGSFASGWAFPAWGMHDLTIWPEDRLPKPGQGVWVMFESTSPDKMIWISAFGVPERPVGDYDDEAFIPSLTWDLATDLEYQEQFEIEGRLMSPIGVPNPNPRVYLMHLAPGLNQSWAVVGSADVHQTTGDWAIPFTMNYADGASLKIVFGGTGLFPARETDVVEYSAFQYTVDLTWDVRPTLAWGVNKTFSGTLTTTQGTLPDNCVVWLEAKAQTSNTWIRKKSATVNSNGDWSLQYACDIPDIDMRIAFDRTEAWNAAQSGIDSQSVATTTTVSKPSMSPSTLYYGQTVTATGTIKDSLNKNVTSGQAQLQYRRYFSSGWGSWTNSGHSNAKKNVTNGSYSLQAGGVSTLGYYDWRVVYTGSGQYLDSTSGSTRKDCNIGNSGSMSKSTVTHTSARMGWPAVAGASGYDLDWHDGSWKNWAHTTSRDVTRTGLGHNRRYYFRVRPYGTTDDGRTVYGGWSANISMNTGRPKQTDSGTSGWIDVFSVASGSWKTSTTNRWGERGDKILQGAYSGYQQYGYFRGLIDYGHHGVYNKVHSALGGGSRATNRINNGSAVSGTAAVFLWKNCGVGTNGAITLRWYRTNTAAGSNPGKIGSAYDRGTTACGAGNWIHIGNSHGTNIVKSKNRGMCVIYDSTASSRYGEFNGRSAGHWDCVLHLKWTWSYTSVSYIAPKWY